MNQFYIRLPSDSSMNTYPNNTVAHFNTKLAERIHLDGQFEVALTEFIYPNNWINFGKGMRLYEDDSEYLEPEYDLRSGYFATAMDLISDINQQIRHYKLTPAYFEYDVKTEKVSIISTRANSIGMNDTLRDFLGFKENDTFRFGRTTAEKTFVLNAGLYLMYIYSDIVSYSLVGDTKTPLLRVCNMSGKHGDEIRVTFTNPQYIPVACQDFETIEININNELGKPMPFLNGKSVITLHFRRK